MLWKAFKTDKFSFDEAQKTLSDDGRIVNLCLSELRRANWLSSFQNPDDTRRKLYQLNNPENILGEIAKEETDKLGVKAR